MTHADPVSVSRKTPDELKRAVLYAVIVAQSILKWHASRILGAERGALVSAERELTSYFSGGTFNDVAVFEAWFQDGIVD
jgi:hypothetical protein